MVGWLAFFLIAASNFVPLAGVLFWHWNIFFLLMAFWFDSVAAGIWVAVYTGITESPAAGISVTLLFAVFFGFLLVPVAGLSGYDELPRAIAHGFTLPGIYWAFGVSLAAHGVGLAKVLSEPRAEREADANVFKAIPFERILLVFIIAGVGLFTMRGRNVGVAPLVVLLFFKALGDVFSHGQEQARRSRRMEAVKSDGA